MEKRKSNDVKERIVEAAIEGLKQPRQVIQSAAQINNDSSRGELTVDNSVKAGRDAIGNATGRSQVGTVTLTQASLGLDPQQIKRNRDLEQLVKLFSQVTRWEINAFLNEASSGYVRYSFSTHYWEGFMAVLDDANFHLHDAKAKELIREFADPVQKMMSIAAEWMHLTTSGTKLTFGNDSRNLATPGFDGAVKKFQKYYRAAFPAYRNLYAYLRENYLDLDFDKSDAAALADYKSYHQDG